MNWFAANFMVGVSVIAQGLWQSGERGVPDRPGEVRLFAVVRNEAERLPYFLKYYSGKGVHRFFIVDNASTDGTRDLLVAAERVHVFATAERYSESEYGVAWLETLLVRYGVGHWCVIADADEFLIYPGAESLDLTRLCEYLSAERASAMHCILADMYSERPIEDTEYFSGSDPMKACPYFESESILCLGSLSEAERGEQKHTGGMRRRLFGLNVRLDKFALLKYDPGMKLQAGLHNVCPVVRSKIRGAVLHFKYFKDFPRKATAEARRGEHWNDSYEYKRYAEVFAHQKKLSAFGSLSRRLRSSVDLIASGIMRCPQDFAKVLIPGGRL